MCLAMPMQVVEIINQDRAVVSLGGMRKQIATTLVDGIEVNDYVIVHVGYALTKMDETEAQKTLQLLQEMASVDDQHQQGTC